MPEEAGLSTVYACCCSVLPGSIPAAASCSRGEGGAAPAVGKLPGSLMARRISCRSSVIASECGGPLLSDDAEEEQPL